MKMRGEGGGGYKISRIFFYEICQSLIPTDTYYPRSIKNLWTEENERCDLQNSLWKRFTDTSSQKFDLIRISVFPNITEVCKKITIQ